MSSRLSTGASALPRLSSIPLFTLLSLSPLASDADARMLAPGAAGADAAPAAALVRLAEISDAEVADWSRYVELAEGTASRLGRARKVEEIVILRTLAGQLDARLGAGQEAPAELARREEALAAELASLRLDRRLAELETPSEAAIRADFAARRESLRHPRLWRLSDLFKAVPRTASAAERAAARAVLEALRARLVAGESFADLARAESESSTRERGGAAGFVALDDLRPELARVVAELEPGELSPVVELPGGFVLLLCGGIDPEREATLEEERADIVARLRAERVRERRAAIDAGIDAGIGGIGGMGDSATVPATAPRSARLDAEARRLGWTPNDDDRILTYWKRLALRAQWAADLAVAERVSPPTAEEIAAAWAAPGAGWIEPRKRHLRALTLEIDRERAASTYERFLAAGRELAAGTPPGQALERTQQSVAPLARLEELGWLTDDEVWALGRNAEAAIRALAVGRLSPAVQEGRRLRIFELLGERPERRKTLLEATPEIRGALVTLRRREAIEAIRREILANAGAAPLPPATDASGGGS